MPHQKRIYELRQNFCMKYDNILCGGIRTMGSIVSYARLAGKKKAPKRDEIMYGKLIDRLQKNPATEYTIAEAENLADEVLKETGRDNLIGPIPVIKIAQEFGFVTYHEGDMAPDVSGNIYIGGTTKKVYGRDNVITVGDNEELYHQRFIVAHELAHYLMDYLGNELYKDPNRLFSRAYTANNHDSQEERRADRFAAELLMPAKNFYRQYMRAMETSEGNRKYAVAYLSKYFETKKSSVRRRIQELA